MRVGPICILALAACAMPATGAFKCVDEKGRTHIEDTPPAACANVVTYEINRSGAVIRKIEPGAVVGDERAAKAKAADDEKASAEQKRRDKAILDSYASEREIDVVRDRNIATLNTRLSASRANLQKAELREKEVQRLADSKGRAVSTELAADLERAKTERAAAAASVARLEKDLDATQARFAADKKRWLELRGTK